jgi:hypothetical protein
MLTRLEICIIKHTMLLIHLWMFMLLSSQTGKRERLTRVQISDVCSVLTDFVCGCYSAFLSLLQDFPSYFLSFLFCLCLTLSPGAKVCAMAFSYSTLSKSEKERDTEREMILLKALNWTTAKVTRTTIKSLQRERVMKGLSIKSRAAIEWVVHQFIF